MTFSPVSVMDPQFSLRRCLLLCHCRYPAHVFICLPESWRLGVIDFPMLSCVSLHLSPIICLPFLSTVSRGGGLRLFTPVV